MTSLLYCHPKNMDLLWEVFYKSPFFYENSITRLQFQTLVQQYYQDHLIYRAAKHSLDDLNRQTMAYMIETLKAARQPRPQPSPAVFQEPYTRQDLLQDRQQSFQESLAQRQAMYATMQSPPPAPVDFRQAIGGSQTFAEEPMTNLAELVEQQKRERDLLQRPVAATTPSHPRLHIDPNAEPIAITVLENLPVTDAPASSYTSLLRGGETTPKKRVTWQDDGEFREQVLIKLDAILNILSAFTPPSSESGRGP